MTGSAPPPTQAVLAFQVPATKKLCVARYTESGWQAAAAVLGASVGAAAPFICDDGTFVVVNGRGDALVLRSQATATDFQLVALSQPAAADSWTQTTLDTGMADGVLPNGAFNADGDAFVAWRRHSAKADPTLVQAARLSGGTWNQQLISDPGVDTRFPRVSVLSRGDATVLFSAQDGDGKFRPRASQYHSVSARWDDSPTPLVDSKTGGESQFATTLTYLSGVTFIGASTVWNETNPADTSQRRLTTVHRTR